MAGIAHPADQFAFGNILANIDFDDAEMSVESLKAVAMVDDNCVTVSAFSPAGNDHLA